MDNALKDLKESLRAVAVSSPTRLDAKSLLRDYRMLHHEYVPVRKFGYRDPVKFLRDKCGDCFLFQGSPKNPELTVIVTPNLEHLDRCVKSQHLSPKLEKKGRRQSVTERQVAEYKAQYILKMREAKKKLSKEISEIIADHPEGVWCIDLLPLYRERHSRELNLELYGNVPLLALAMEAGDVVAEHHRSRGDYLLINRAYAPSPPPSPRPRRKSLNKRPSTPDEPDDALPGVPNDPDVFSWSLEDCMGLLDSIPAASLMGVGLHNCLPVYIGEVYSPSHFWMLRISVYHYAVLETIMKEMKKYYESAEGRARRLDPGNVRVGYYCSGFYQGDWHRSLIVQIVDSTTVKVQHVDYGSVECYDVSALRPLLRRWGKLPAQALRTRMTAVRPYGPGCRWPMRATMRFLELVSGRQLMAVVSAVDKQDQVLEVYLVNTATEVDVCIGDEMLSEGHARPAVVGSAIRSLECYLLPEFAPLESGDRFNYAEVCDAGDSCATASGSTTSPARLPEESQTLPSDPADSPPLSSPAASHCDPFRNQLTRSLKLRFKSAEYLCSARHLE